MNWIRRLGVWGLYVLAFSSLLKTAPAHIGAALSLPAAVAALVARRHQAGDLVGRLTLVLALWLLLRYAMQLAGLGEAGLIGPGAVVVDWLFPLLFAPFALVAAEDRLRHLARLWLLALLGCTAGVATFLARRGAGVLWSGERLGFHFDRPLGIGLYAGCFIILLLGTVSIWWRAPGRWHWPARALGVAMLALYGEVLITAQSRSTYLALLPALLVLGAGWLGIRRRTGAPIAKGRVLLAALLLGATLAGLAALNWGVIGQRLGAERAVLSTIDNHGLVAAPPSSISARLRLWQYALQRFPDAPWIGHGFGSLVDVINSQLRSKAALPLGERYDHLHNSYLQVLWSQGLIGVVLWGALLAALLWDVARAARADARIRALLPAVGGVVTFVALWACFDYRLSHVDTRMFALLALLSLRRLGMPDSSPGDDRPAWGTSSQAPHGHAGAPTS